MSTHCQLFANPQSIHRQFIANRVRIQFKSIVNPCQYKSTLMPIHCQSTANLLPIQVNPPPMQHKCSQSTDLTFQCLFVTNPPIRDKFANSFHFSQSIADPMALLEKFFAESTLERTAANSSCDRSRRQIVLIPFSILVRKHLHI